MSALASLGVGPVAAVARALGDEVRMLWTVMRGSRLAGTQGARMEAFYAPQAEAYDRSRENLLHGRRELVESLALPDGGRLVEMGCGTGRNLEFFGDRLGGLERVEAVDLCPSLLARARQRVSSRGWDNVVVCDSDACAHEGDGQPVDVVYFSYSLTMIPDRRAALDRAVERLRPGGLLGVVDFHLAGSASIAGRLRMNGLERSFWRRWFGHAGVWPSVDHVPYLERALDPVHYSEHRGPVPYVPFVRVPHFRFIGRKRARVA